MIYLRSYTIHKQKYPQYEKMFNSLGRNGIVFR